MLDLDHAHALVRRVEIEGVLNRHEDHAINCVVPEAVVDMTSLWLKGSTDWLQVAWNRMTEEQHFILLNGFHRIWIVKHILGPKVKKHLAELIGFQQESVGRPNMSLEDKLKLKQLEESIVWQQTEVNKVCLWLV
jgi:dihydrodipicolinate synthase/N-acetylneuraminate lyase